MAASAGAAQQQPATNSRESEPGSASAPGWSFGRAPRSSRRTRVQPRAARPHARSVTQPSPLLFGALVLVLALRAYSHRPFPRRPVAVVGGSRIGRRVRLSLVGALLVVDHLRPLAAAGDPEEQRTGEDHERIQLHDLPPGAAGAGAGAVPGAVPAAVTCGRP